MLAQQRKSKKNKHNVQSSSLHPDAQAKEPKPQENPSDMAFEDLLNDDSDKKKLAEAQVVL